MRADRPYKFTVMNHERIMNIRKFQDADRSSLIKLWNTVFPDDPPHNEPSIIIEAKLAVDDLIFVAEYDGKLIGACMAGYDGHRGWLYAVAVLKDQRRSGTGATLVKHAMQSLKEIGCIKVNLQIRSTNTEVAAFYKSLGFATEERLSMGVFIE
jgi:ribosomal protein S18 acetylase RimI-like enzyme